jgi:hypothetical protein
MVKQPTVYSLCTAIKVLQTKIDIGDAKQEQSGAKWLEKKNQLQIRQGKFLGKLKERKPNDKPWYEYVSTHCNISKSRADELIRIAEGHTTVEQVREAKKQTVRKSRAKRTLQQPRSVRSSPVKPNGNGKTNGKFQDAAKVNTCDFDPTDKRPVKDEPYSVTRLRSYQHAVREATALAKSNLFMAKNKADWATLNPDEITDAVIAGAQQVADAWLDVVETLQRRRLANGRESQAETRPSIH